MIWILTGGFLLLLWFSIHAYRLSYALSLQCDRDRKEWERAHDDLAKELASVKKELASVKDEHQRYSDNLAEDLGRILASIKHDIRTGVLRKY